jgi:hypothetical protein
MFGSNKLKEEVKAHLTSEVYKDVMTFVKSRGVRLQGVYVGRGGLETYVCLALYKDIKSIGFQRLEKQFKGKITSVSVNSKTLRTNIHRIRALLAEWGQTKIKLGNLRDWTSTMRGHAPPIGLEGVCLWADSSDFALAQPTRWSKKDPEHSHKLDRRASRYFFLQDGLQKIRYITGPYLPKTQDSQKIRELAPYLSANCAGATIIGDGHFWSERDRIPNVPIIAPQPKPLKKRTHKRKRDEEENDNIEGLPPKTRQRNKAIRDFRARVERPFYHLVQIFPSLDQPWMDDEHQQDHVIWTAAGVHNAKLLL